MKIQKQVCVIGAGISGLYAAIKLKEKGYSVVVLEARDRVGGRTHEASILNRSVDIGGQWIGPEQKRVNRLVKDLGLETFAQYAEGYQLLELNGRLTRYRGVIPKLPLFTLLAADRAIKNLNRLSESLDRAEPWSSPIARELDQMTAEQWLIQNVRTSGARELIRLAVRAILSAEASEVSMLYFLNYISQAGSLEQLADVDGAAQQDRILPGAFEISRRLAATLSKEEVVLSQKVRRVHQQSAGKVEIFTDSVHVECDFAVVALSPGLTASIDFTGDLNTEIQGERMTLARRMPMGSVTKALIAYERPFWRDMKLSGMVVSDRGPFGPVFDAGFPGDESGYLVGFLEGEEGRRFALSSESQRKHAIVESLVRWFGPEAANPKDYVEKNWTVDPFSGGCYTGFMIPGTLTNFGTLLRKPVGRVYWAGTETATEWTGYFEGALEAAERVVGEIQNEI